MIDDQPVPQETRRPRTALRDDGPARDARAIRGSELWALASYVNPSILDAVQEVLAAPVLGSGRASRARLHDLLSRDLIWCLIKCPLAAPVLGGVYAGPGCSRDLLSVDPILFQQRKLPNKQYHHPRPTFPPSIVHRGPRLTHCSSKHLAATYQPMHPPRLHDPPPVGIMAQVAIPSQAAIRISITHLRLVSAPSAPATAEVGN